MPGVMHGAARAGLIAKGVMYGLLSLLALRVAAGDPASANSQGALHSVAAQPPGTLLLGLLAVGFLAYAVWQVVAFRRADDWPHRAAAVTRAVVWSGLAFSAARLILGERLDRNAEEALTAKLLDWPLGPWLVGAAGAALVVVGLSRLKDLRGHRYLDDLRPVPARTRKMIQVVTVAGIGAKAAVFSLVGAFLVRAGIRHRPRSGVGLDGALGQLSREPYGTWLLAAVATGLAAYAVWCWVRARYEHVERSEG